MCGRTECSGDVGTKLLLYAYGVSTYVTRYVVHLRNPKSCGDGVPCVLATVIATVISPDISFLTPTSQMKRDDGGSNAEQRQFVVNSFTYLCFDGVKAIVSQRNVSNLLGFIVETSIQGRVIGYFS